MNCNRQGQAQVVLLTVMWNGRKIRGAGNSYRGTQEKTKIKADSMFWRGFIYMGMSKEWRQGYLPTLNNLIWYTVHLPPWNHYSYSDVLPQSHPMILHTPRRLLPTQPYHIVQHHNTSNYFQYWNKLYHHHSSIVPYVFHITQCLCLPVILILCTPSAHLQYHSQLPSYYLEL